MAIRVVPGATGQIPIVAAGPPLPFRARCRIFA